MIAPGVGQLSAAETVHEIRLPLADDMGEVVVARLADGAARITESVPDQSIPPYVLEFSAAEWREVVKAGQPVDPYHSMHTSQFEAFECYCGAELLIPEIAATVIEWRERPEAKAWFSEHRPHAGCAGISIRRRGIAALAKEVRRSDSKGNDQ
jgi:hypothetical protein